MGHNPGFMVQRDRSGWYVASEYFSNDEVFSILGMNKKNSCQVIEAYFKENELQKRVFCDFNDYWEQLFNE